MGESRERLIARGGWAEDRILDRSGPPYGPVNTWSNAAYAIVGVYVAWRYQDDASAALAVALWVLATGSALYHAYKTVWANRMDWVGMYGVFGAIAAHGWLAAWPWASWVMLAAGAGVVAVYRAQHWVSADLAMVALGIVGSIPVVWSGDRRLLAISWGLFALAYGVWHLDKARVRFIGRWGHAIWHVVAAIAIGVLFAAQYPKGTP